MAGWQFELVGNDLDLAQLITLFGEGRVRVARHDDKVWIEADDIAIDTDIDDATIAADGLLRTMNGIAVLSSSGTGLVTLGSAVLVDSAGRRHLYVTPAPARLTLRTMPPTVLIGGVSVPPHEQRILAIAIANADVDHILRMYGGRNLDWRDLYVILEVIEEDVGGMSAIADRGWAGRSDLELFHRTANSRRAIGDLARHGTTKFDPPTKPMTIAEARRTIGHVVRRWLREKTS